MLNGKVILVTGAGGGIGSTTCRVLAQHGARVVASDVNAEAGQRVASEIQAIGAEAIFLRADMASEDSIRSLMDDACDAYGRLDGAFNNAGVEQQNVPIDELTLAQWEQCVRIDLTSIFLCLKFQSAALLRSGGGAIVNMASGLAQIGIPNAAEYIAAKHGVIGLTRAAAIEYGPRGVRVNAVLPGIVETELIARLRDREEFRTFLERSRERHILGRFAKASEIGEAVAWLLSERASFVNGIGMPVDGGYLAN